MSSPKTVYLIAYNLVFATLWLTLLVRILAINPVSNYDITASSVGSLVEKIQLAAFLDVFHSVIGLVRAPFGPTFVQTSAKSLILWQIVRPFPDVALSPAYTFLLLAWSVGEVIRYSYFALMLSGLDSAPIVWLRYSAFIPIYPLGFLSEMVLVFLALQQCENPWFSWLLRFELCLYAPGSYFLYGHMLKQRRKALRGISLNSAPAK